VSVDDWEGRRRGDSKETISSLLIFVMELRRRGRGWGITDQLGTTGQLKVRGNSVEKNWKWLSEETLKDGFSCR
jgi:hypothetical protein